MGFVSAGVTAVANDVKERTKSAIERMLKTKAKKEALKALQPDWWLKDIKQRARSRAISEVFHPENTTDHIDVMCRKSLSPAAKVWIIQDRLEKEDMGDDRWLNHRLKKTMWEQATGYDDTEDFW